MNIQEKDILQIIIKNPSANQRFLTEVSGYSMGSVNRAIRNLIESGYLNANVELTLKAKEEFLTRAPRNAVILAAGMGMRMVPINLECPKGLLEVRGEPLIERLIKQLHEVGIKEIYVVVGFMKERYEYLIDEFGVELIINNDYAVKNNLYSLQLVSGKISNTYIVPCDIWCERNPFSRFELYSWYMISDLADDESEVWVNRKKELVLVQASESGNAMIGIAYLLDEDSRFVKQRIVHMCQNRKNRNAFWETILYEKDKMVLAAKLVPASEVMEINTYEQLRELDGESTQLKSDVLKLIAEEFDVSVDEIIDISVLKKGMTNRSFCFSCRGRRYIMRIPGEGTQRLIDRRQEAQVYRIIAGRGLCDDLVYLNPDNGYKITKYLEGVRVCDPDSVSDLRKCMDKLREFHHMKLTSVNEFDIFAQIDFYENLWGGQPSVYKDYKQTKQNVFSLRKYIDEHISSYCLTHIDAVPDNFLFFVNEAGQEMLYLTDWEYAGMQDPHVDIAMFCIYSFYDKSKVDRLIDIYFENECLIDIRIKIYCYIAVCGLLWSNWCEYKRNLGVEFGEYSLRQYRYAKEYFKIARREIEIHALCE